MNKLPEILTAQNIADYLRISRRRVYELMQLDIKKGGLPGFSIGASKRVDKEDFFQWLEEQKKRTG